MAEKGTVPQQRALPDKLPELAQLVLENEKLRRKHRKAQQRRDHYARLYYRCQADLDEKKLELHYAREKIKELKAQIAASSLPHTKHLPHSSTSRSEILPRPSMKTHIHHPHPNSQSYYDYYQHSQQSQQQHQLQDMPSKINAPNSIPPHPSHVPCRGYDSDSTSPDSGASFSPGMGSASGADPLLHSHPASSFPHSNVQGSRTRSMTLPHSMRFHQEKSSVSKGQESVFTHDRERERERERVRVKEGGEIPERKRLAWHDQRKGDEIKGKTEEEDWVSWVKEQNLPALYQVGVSNQRQPQDQWRGKEDERGQKTGKGAPECGSMSDESTTTPRSPVNFQNSAPPSSIVASPLATHRTHPSFEPHPPTSLSFSLSQGSSLPHSPSSPPLPHSNQKKRPNHVHFSSLSQNAYMSSPLYIRKPAFKDSVTPSTYKVRSQPVAEVLDGRGECQSPLPRVTPTQGNPNHFSDTEEESQSQVQSAFRKPQVYRQTSQPSHLVSPTRCPPAEYPNRRLAELHLSPPSNPPDNHLPSHPLSHVKLSPSHTHSSIPNAHSSHPPFPHSQPPPPPSSLPLSHSTPHMAGFDPVDTSSPLSPHYHFQHSQLPQQGQPRMGVVNHQRGVANTEIGVVSMTTSTSLSDQNTNHQTTKERAGKEDEESDTEDEEEPEGEGEEDNESYYENLTAVQMLELLSKIGDPKCTVKKLEIVDSELGKPEAMKVLCRDLRRNKSLREISFPNNDIGADSLQVLLECIQQCPHIRELKLRGNNIGKRCAPLIKAFMEQTNLDSLVLTGNEIEQHGDLLHRAMPSDFTMEFDTAEGSVDSGVVVADTDQFNNSHTSLKYLHV